MASVPTEAELRELEALVDRYNLFEVVMALSVVCGDKAAHIRANWQDNATAAPWDKAADKLEDVARGLNI